MTNILRSGGSTTLAPDTVPAAVAASQSSVTLAPDPGTFTFGSAVTTGGGRALVSFAGTVTWEVVSGSGITLDTATGEVSAGSDGSSLVIRPKYDDAGAGLHFVGANVTVTCSAFSGMSTDAAAQLDTLGGTNFHQSLRMVNQFVPGVTPLTEDSTLAGVGWWASVQNSITQGTVGVVNKPSAVYGKSMFLLSPWSPGLPIDHFDRQIAPQMYLSVGADANDLVASYYWAHRGSGATGIAIQGWPGPAYGYHPGGFFDGLARADGIGCGIVDSSTVRLGSHVAHGGTHYVCILKHTVGASDTDGTEPGVGASWATYWSAVAALAVAPPAWALNTAYDTIDSTSWPTYSTPGQAKLCFSGGSGTAHLVEIPDYTRSSFFGNVEYEYYDMSVNADFSANDNTGGDKAISSNLSNGDPGFATTGFIQGPGWGTTDADDPAAPLIIGGSFYYLDRYNGSAVPPPGSYQPPPWVTGITFGQRYVVEVITKHPTLRGDDSEYWVFVNGTLEQNATYRVSAGTPYAFRAMTIVIDNVRGGGGCMPIKPDGQYDNASGNFNYYDEIYHARGVTDPLLAPANLNATCEEGATPSHSSTSHYVFEIRDGNGNRVDCGSAFFPSSGSQPVVVTLSGPGAVGATWTNAFNDAISGGMSGRIRIAVSGGSAGSLTVACSLKPFANNDTWDSVTTYDGSVTVTLT